MDLQRHPPVENAINHFNVRSTSPAKSEWPGVFYNINFIDLTGFRFFIQHSSILCQNCNAAFALDHGNPTDLGLNVLYAAA